MHPRSRLHKPASILTSILLNFTSSLSPLASHIRGTAISSSSHHKIGKNCQQYNSHPSQAESVSSKDKNTLYLSILPDSATTQSNFPTRIKVALYEQRPQGATFSPTESCEWGGGGVSIDRGDLRQFPGFGHLWLPLDFPKDMPKFVG